MVDIGINYIDGNEKCYEILKRYGYIDTIKFPGRTCDYHNLTKFVEIAQNLDLKMDLHGLPGMLPAFNCMSDEFLSNVDMEHLKNILDSKNISRFSTHMGIKHQDSLDNYSTEAVEKKWNKNYYDLKSRLESILSKNVEIGLENIPGGFMFDKRTLTPEYISQNWRNADFGVFDVCHGKLASKVLNMDFYKYMEMLDNKDKVKIIHISGNTDYNDKYTDKPDKHVLINENEIEDFIKVINMFKNVDLVVSEYSFDSIFSEPKEIIIEAVVLNRIVRTKNIEISKNVLKYLKENLKNDISNLEELFETMLWKQINE